MTVKAPKQPICGRCGSAKIVKEHTPECKSNVGMGTLPCDCHGKKKEIAVISLGVCPIQAGPLPTVCLFCMDCGAIFSIQIVEVTPEQKRVISAGEFV